MRHPWLSAEDNAALEAEAKRRNVHVDVLAAMLLGIVAADNLFSALLDD
jgi:hypothetical protein